MTITNDKDEMTITNDKDRLSAFEIKEMTEEAERCNVEDKIISRKAKVISVFISCFINPRLSSFFFSLFRCLAFSKCSNLQVNYHYLTLLKFIVKFALNMLLKFCFCFLPCFIVLAASLKTMLPYKDLSQALVWLKPLQSQTSSRNRIDSLHYMFICLISKNNVNLIS